MDEPITSGRLAPGVFLVGGFLVLLEPINGRDHLVGWDFPGVFRLDLSVKTDKDFSV